MRTQQQRAAADAIRRGFHIFPVARGAKVPHHLTGSWGETATNQMDRVQHFWTYADPEANVGIACKNSRLLVVDCDVAKTDWNLRGTEWETMHEANGVRVNGVDLLLEMAFAQSETDDYQEDFQTYAVRTGSGGVHFYYTWPANYPQTSQASPVKGLIDVRGNGGQWGGYVLAEGSRTAAGDYEVFCSKPPKLPPPWIIQMVMEKQPVRRVSANSAIRQPGAISWSGLVDSVQYAREGNRNNALLWASRAMCSDGASEEVAKDVLGVAARKAGLADFEIERTIESGYRAQQRKEGS